MWSYVLAKVEDPNQLLSCWRTCSLWNSVLRNVFSQLVPVVLPQLSRYLSQKELLQCRLVCKKWKDGVDTLIQRILSESGNSMRFDSVSTRLIPTVTVTWPLIPKCQVEKMNPSLRGSLVINTVPEENSPDEVIDEETVIEFLKQHGMNILRLRLKIQGDTSFLLRQKLIRYLECVPNLERLEFQGEVHLLQWDTGTIFSEEWSMYQQIVWDRDLFPSVFLPSLKSLTMHPRYVGERENTGRCTHAGFYLPGYFTKLFRTQFDHLRILNSTDSCVSNILNKFVFMRLSELDLAVRGGSTLRDFASCSVTSIQKLTFRWASQDLAVITPLEQMRLMSRIASASSSLHHLHMHFQGLQRDIFPTSEFARGFSRLTTLTVTNGILCRNLGSLKDYSSRVKRIHLVFDVVPPEEDIVGTEESGVNIWEELRHLQVFTYQKREEQWIFRSRDLFEFKQKAIVT